VDGKPEVTDGEKLTAGADDGTSIARQLTAHHVRSLTDYAFLFHDLADRATRVFQQNILYDREKIRLAESLQEANKQIGFRQGEVDKLTAEKTFQEKDRDTAQTYVDKLTSERETLRVELAELFNVNRQLSQQLADIQARLEAEINKRTEAVGRDSE
jgi:chromosome segregation ATPase